MAIFRCNKCGHIREVGIDYIGKSVKCPECEQITTIHDTVTFLKALIKKYIAQNKELQSLQQESSKNNLENQFAENISFEEIDIHNTNALAQANNLEPISQWFEKRKVKVHFNPDSADTTGFFDEIALKLGNNFDVLSCVSNQIKYVQNKGYSSVKIEVSKKNPQDIQKVTAFCKELYDYSFVAKYFYQKNDKVIRLTLQTAPRIREFFNGLWMEWFTLMKLLHFFREKKIAPACTRALDISFNGGNSNELDLFILTENNVPVCIECKTGEFRQDIDKYLSLRKQLDISKNQFVICVFGLSNEQARGMTSMYDLTFVNESSIIDHIDTVIYT
ncbi:MAG: hypothetical protein MUO63_09685 [Desulfobulbaceae bacterium]|nr:hypothetical protein [Desulfobulbaceae bacterium]